MFRVARTAGALIMVRSSTMLLHLDLTTKDQQPLGATMTSCFVDGKVTNVSVAGVYPQVGHTAEESSTAVKTEIRTSLEMIRALKTKLRELGQDDDEIPNMDDLDEAEREMHRKVCAIMSDHAKGNQNSRMFVVCVSGWVGVLCDSRE